MELILLIELSMGEVNLESVVTPRVSPFSLSFLEFHHQIIETEDPTLEDYFLLTQSMQSNAQIHL